MSTRIVDVRVSPVDIPLREPFGIAGGALAVAENVLVEVELEDGTVGLGEAAPFPAFNGETRGMVLQAMPGLAPRLRGQDVASWRRVCAQISAATATVRSARCALQCAVLDAFCRHHRVPMWSFFGGNSTELETDLTITTGTTEHAALSAADIARQGYRTIKLKVGGSTLEADLQRLGAAARAAPSCGLILDANGGYSSVQQVLDLVQRAGALGARVVLLEQPLPPSETSGLRELTSRSAAPVAADEGAGSVRDVVHIAREGLAHVVNVKATKSGLVEAWEMMRVADALGLRVMVGAMVETVVTTGASACLAAGLGGVSFVDLDTPLWMTDSPVVGGYVQTGPRLDLSGITAGHGATRRGPAGA